VLAYLLAREQDHITFTLMISLRMKVIHEFAEHSPQ
jgi:hypothetical protein